MIYRDREIREGQRHRGRQTEGKKEKQRHREKGRVCARGRLMTPFTVHAVWDQPWARGSPEHDFSIASVTVEGIR